MSLVNHGRLESGKSESAGSPRTLSELAAAIAYLEIMHEQSKDDPDEEKGKLVGKVASKGMDILLWAAGEDNRFGDLVARFIAQCDSTALPESSNPQRQPCNQKRRKR